MQKFRLTFNDNGVEFHEDCEENLLELLEKLGNPNPSEFTLEERGFVSVPEGFLDSVRSRQG